MKDDDIETKNKKYLVSWREAFSVCMFNCRDQTTIGFCLLFLKITHCLRLEFGCDPFGRIRPNPPPFFFFISLESGMTSEKPNFFAHIFGVVLGSRPSGWSQEPGSHVFRSLWSHLSWSFFWLKMLHGGGWATHFKKYVFQSNWIMNPQENRSDFFQNIGGFTTIGPRMDHQLPEWQNRLWSFCRMISSLVWASRMAAPGGDGKAPSIFNNRAGRFWLFLRACY